MAALLRGDLRGTNDYQQGRLGTGCVVKCEGADLTAWDPKGFYSEEQIEGYVADLVAGRSRRWRSLVPLGSTQLA